MLLLDTDVLIDIFRNRVAATQWLCSVQHEAIVVPGFAAMELLQGCRNLVEQDDVRRRLARYQVVWPLPANCDAALESFASFRLVSGLGLIDALIAHTAIEMSLPLHTFNVKHYAIIPGLKTIQPYQR